MRRRDTSQVRGKVVAITGAARGIGLASAWALHDAGAVVAIGDVNEQTLSAAAREFGFTALPLDVTHERSFTTFLDTVEATHGPLDVLVNNAGIMPVGPFTGYSEALTQRTIEVDLLGVIRGCRLAAGRMVQHGRGHIINVASIAGRLPAPGLSIYTAAKFGVIGFSEALDAELGPRQVRVSTIQPSFTTTPLIDGLQDRIPLPPVTPDDVARAILDVIRTRRLHTVVPKTAAPVAMTGVIPARLKRWLLTRPSYASIFTHPDLDQRRAYDDEITSGHPAATTHEPQ